MSIVWGVISSLAVLLVAWIARRTFYRRRLYCVAPRLFEYSTLSASSSVAFIQIQNAGKRAEEKVEVALSPGFKYELLASSAAQVAVERNVGLISLSRLTPGEQVGLLFLVEGSERFKKEHVIGVSSKEAKGRIVSSAADIEASTPKIAVALLAMFVTFGVAANVLYFMAKDTVWPVVREVVLPLEELEFYPACTNTYSNGKASEKDGLTEEALKIFASSTIEIKRVYRIGDYVYAEIHLENPIDIRSEFSVEVKSPAADSSSRELGAPDKSIYNIILLEKGESRDLTLGDYLPRDHKSQLFWADYRINLDGSYWIHFDQRVYLDREAAERCGMAVEGDPPKQSS